MSWFRCAPKSSPLGRSRSMAWSKRLRWHVGSSQTRSCLEQRKWATRYCIFKKDEVEIEPTLEKNLDFLGFFLLFCISGKFWVWFTSSTENHWEPRCRLMWWVSVKHWHVLSAFYWVHATSRKNSSSVRCSCQCFAPAGEISKFAGIEVEPS